MGYKTRNLRYRQLVDGLEIYFPSFHHYKSVCGGNCQWAYALKMSNVKSRETTTVAVNVVKQDKPRMVTSFESDCNEIDCS